MICPKKPKKGCEITRFAGHQTAYSHARAKIEGMLSKKGSTRCVICKTPLKNHSDNDLTNCYIINEQKKSQKTSKN